jgi:PleD family two-component response regulator
MIREADQAMYFSKRMGRNRFIHFLDMPEDSQRL